MECKEAEEGGVRHVGKNYSEMFIELVKKDEVKLWQALFTIVYHLSYKTLLRRPLFFTSKQFLSY